MTLAEAQVLAQTSGEDKENNPNELAVMQATLNRIQSENKQVQTTLGEREQELSLLKIQHTEQQNTIEQLVSLVQSSYSANVHFLSAYSVNVAENLIQTFLVPPCTN